MVIYRYPKHCLIINVSGVFLISLFMYVAIPLHLQHPKAPYFIAQPGYGVLLWELYF